VAAIDEAGAGDVIRSDGSRLPGRAGARERIAIAGFGRIGRRLAQYCSDRSAGSQLCALLVRERDVGRARAIAADETICTRFDDFLNSKPDVVVECASAATLCEIAPRLLAAGSDLIPLSLGAFADPGMESLLLESARAGPGRIEIPAGAIGSIGFLAAAREHDLQRVAMSVAYPPDRWKTMKAGRFIDLGQVRRATTFLQGSAREIAALFPGHLNVTIAVGLAGLGLDRTSVSLIVDPDISQAWFEVEAISNSGPVRLRVDGRNAPVEDDPIDYTTFSVIRLLRRRQDPIAI
jgi:aspartate dehydrogenase